MKENFMLIEREKVASKVGVRIVGVNITKGHQDIIF